LHRGLGRPFRFRLKLGLRFYLEDLVFLGQDEREMLRPKLILLPVRLICNLSYEDCIAISQFATTAGRQKSQPLGIDG
jgi:hypothetical protein